MALTIIAQLILLLLLAIVSTAGGQTPTEAASQPVFTIEQVNLVEEGPRICARPTIGQKLWIAVAWKTLRTSAKLTETIAINGKWIVPAQKILRPSKAGQRKALLPLAFVPSAPPGLHLLQVSLRIGAVQGERRYLFRFSGQGLPGWAQAISNELHLEAKTLQSLRYTTLSGEEVLDMASPFWQALPHHLQILYATTYRRVYAAQLGLPVEQTFQAGSVSWAMVFIPAGRFLLGSPADQVGRDIDEGPVRETVVTEPFWLGASEVTVGQWEAIMGPALGGRKSAPEEAVGGVAWTETEEFLRRLGPGYHLPGEAQWEYACRSGSTSPFYWGKDPTGQEIEEYAWSQANTWRGTGEVGYAPRQKRPNAWGLYDMSGNRAEWCADIYRPYAGTPSTAPDLAFRVYRGGHRHDPPVRCRCASRNYDDASLRDAVIGFRLAYSLALP